MARSSFHAGFHAGSHDDVRALASVTNHREELAMQDVTDPRDPVAIKKAQAQVAELKAMFDASAPARAQRQRDKPLYERLGGRGPITAVVTDIVELHFTEPVTAPLCKGVDK